MKNKKSSGPFKRGRPRRLFWDDSMIGNSFHYTTNGKPINARQVVSHSAKGAGYIVTTSTVIKPGMVTVYVIGRSRTKSKSDIDKMKREKMNGNGYKMLLRDAGFESKEDVKAAIHK